MEVPIPPTMSPDRQSHELPQLEMAVIPANAHQAVQIGAANARSEQDIKRMMRDTAMRLVFHEKWTDLHHYREPEGPSTLLFFICAVHGLEVPSNDERLAFPPFAEAQLLPLGHWGPLYLALVAEIRQLHARIQETWQAELQGGNLVLHYGGPDGRTSGQPFTALNLAMQIKAAWSMLMDPRVLGQLENEIRKEYEAERYRRAFDEATFRDRFQAYWEKLDSNAAAKTLDAAEGMVNPHALSTAQIDELLWKKYAPMMRQACHEHLGVELDLIERREQLRQSSQDTTAQPTSEQAFCSCDESCNCRLACQFEVDSCACKSGYNQRMESAMMEDREQRSPDFPTPSHPGSSRRHNHTFRGMTNDMRQMQLSSQPSPEGPYHQYSSQQMRGIPCAGGPAVIQSRPQRSNTGYSDLAYVPSVPKTPSRGKDSVPLDFYGSGRYPFRGRRDTAADSHSTQPPPKYELNYTCDPPVRKPILSADTVSTTSTTPAQHGPNESTSSGYATTAVSSSPEPEPLRVNKKFPVLPRLKGKATADERPQAPGPGSPRRPENEFEGWETGHVATPHIAPQRSGVEEIERRPSPFGRHSADSPPRQVRVPPLMARSNTADPAGLNPRPASKQIYRPAGGDARLEDRPELHDFELPPAVQAGISMTREAVMERLASGEFDTPIRPSNESNPRVTQEEEGGGRDGRSSQRGRKGSSVSLGLKRIFSRTHSSSQ